MKDPIERAAAIDAVKCGALSAAMVYGRTDAGSTALSETVKAIKAIPSAQPEQRWIPYWHKYPDNNRFVLVCNDDGRMAIAQYIGHEEDAYHPWQIAYCPYDVDVWDEDENGKIMAWMDLPKPYKENTNDGNGSLSAFEKLRTRILRREYGQNTTAQLRPEQRNNGHTGKSDTDAD